MVNLKKTQINLTRFTVLFKVMIVVVVFSSGFMIVEKTEINNSCVGTANKLAKEVKNHGKPSLIYCKKWIWE